MAAEPKSVLAEFRQPIFSTLALTTVSNGLEALVIGITLDGVYGPETIYNLAYDEGVEISSSASKHNGGVGPLASKTPILMCGIAGSAQETSSLGLWKARMVVFLDSDLGLFRAAYGRASES